MNEKANRHIPVMLQEVLAGLEPLMGAHILDGTFGAGGYTCALLQKGARVIALDRDPQAIATGRDLVATHQDRLHLIQARFSRLDEVVTDPIDAIVFDIGVSSMQIDEGARGFSFQREGPLDMRMSCDGMSASDIVNHFEATDLARIFRYFGEERHALAIARMIVKRRAKKPFTTTLDLAQAIEGLIGRGRARHAIHPATRVFQALRISVNDELGELAAGLMAAERCLKPGGRLAVVSFHSLEDRIVKNFFARRCVRPAPSRHLPQTAQPAASFTLFFKGAKEASNAEKEHNPRARSAKLRIGIRTDAPPIEESVLSDKFRSLMRSIS